MKTIHISSDFLFSIFPEVPEGDIQALLNAIEQYYAAEGIEADVWAKGDIITIMMDKSPESTNKRKFQKAVRLCEQGNYRAAKPILAELIQEVPHDDELHRIMGQIHFEEGEHDTAIDYLIDALRWNPKNTSALILMGNLFAKAKKDVDTALTYYNQVLQEKPDDAIALHNIGANLMLADRVKEAKPYLFKSLESDPDYPNTLHALAMVSHKEGDHEQAFDQALRALKHSAKRDEVYTNALRLALDCANRIASQPDAQHNA